MEAQLDYERLRRERLEAQLDQHRRDMADLSYRLQSRMGDDSGVRFKKEKVAKMSKRKHCFGFVYEYKHS